MTNRLTRITDDAGRKVDYTYDYTGPVPNDTHYWLTKIKNTWNWKVGSVWNQSTLVQYAYTYDNAGMRLTNAVTDASGPVRTETYGYDELYRLTSVNYGDGQTQSYTFDAMGNRSQKVDSVSGTEGYTYNAANMLLTRGAASYTNDTNGNTLTGGGRTNTWDSQNRLYQCVYSGTTTTHTYAADGLRHRSVNGANTTDYVLDSSMFVREWKNSSISATYLVGPRGPEYRRNDVAGTVRWYLYDGLGSVSGEVDVNGNITASRKFDVYGSVRSTTGTSTTKHKFRGSLGHPSEDETGLVYMRARYMDPVTGRFISEDPGQHGNNWFAYVNCNSVNFVDADGKMAEGLPEFLAMILEWLEVGSHALCPNVMESPTMMHIAQAAMLAIAGLNFASLAASVFIAMQFMNIFAFVAAGVLFGVLAIVALALIAWALVELVAVFEPDVYKPESASLGDPRPEGDNIGVPPWYKRIYPRRTVLARIYPCSWVSQPCNLPWRAISSQAEGHASSVPWRSTGCFWTGQAPKKA